MKKPHEHPLLIIFNKNHIPTATDRLLCFGTIIFLIAGIIYALYEVLLSNTNKLYLFLNFGIDPESVSGTIFGMFILAAFLMVLGLLIKLFKSLITILKTPSSETKSYFISILKSNIVIIPYMLILVYWEFNSIFNSNKDTANSKTYLILVLLHTLLTLILIITSKSLTKEIKWFLAICIIIFLIVIGLPLLAILF